MNWVDEICVSCGVCCTTLSIVRINQADIDRLMTGYSLTAEQVHAMVRRDDSQFRIVMDNHASCRALSAREGRYECQAYTHRPGICRQYECSILAGAKAWMAKRDSPEQTGAGNPFETAADETDLRRQVADAIRQLKAGNLADCRLLYNGAKGRAYESLPELLETLAGAEFDHQFPPR